MSIKSEILDIAEEHGYTGTAKTTAAAINALADTLAGEDVTGGRTVASAIHALSPYIGGGGGVGDLVSAPQFSTSVPQVGPKPSDYYFGSLPTSMYRIDGKILLKWGAQTTPPGVELVAAGIEYCIPESGGPSPVTAAVLDTYKVTYDADTNSFTSVTRYDAGIYDEVIDGVAYLVVPMPPLMHIHDTENYITELLFLVLTA